MKKEIQHPNFEQASIFDSDVTTINEKSLRKHNVTFIKRLYTKSMTYEELFEGFEEIYIITYSHSLRLIQDILPNFEKVKIILGNPKIIKDDTLALMAYQEHQMKELRKRAGISPGTYTKIRKNQEVSLSVLMKIAQILNCNAGDLMDFIVEED